MIRMLLLGAMLATLVVSTACKGPQYPNCKTDDQCNVGTGADAKTGVCVFGKCQECAKDADCPNGGRCENNMCLKTCMADGDCGAGQYCQAGICHANCIDSTSCGGGQICNAGRCMTQTACTDKTDCEPGFVCDSGFCAQSAVSTNEEAEKCVMNHMVFFDFDKYEIKTEGVVELDQVSGCLRGKPGVKLLVAGHTDNRGATEYNLSLGERRANAVRDYLVRSGLEEGNLQTVSYGSEKPMVPENNEAAWSKNRRAEISVQ